MAATKRQLYLLPAFPPVALLVGVWLSAVSADTNGSRSQIGELAVRLYSWALVLVFIGLGSFLLWAAPNLGSLTSGRQLNSQELEVLANVVTPLRVLGVVLIVCELAIGAAWKRGSKGAALLSIGGSHVAMYIVILALVLPAFAPTKTYKPQSRWISAEIGGEPRFGMVDAAGVLRRGGFSYYTGTAVDLLEGPNEAAAYLEKYPGTIVLVRSTQFERDFVPVDYERRFRLRGEVRVGSHLYVAVGPASSSEP